MVSTCKEKHHNINVLVWRQVQYVGKLQTSVCCPWLCMPKLPNNYYLQQQCSWFTKSDGRDLYICCRTKGSQKGNKMKHNEINGTYIGKRGKTRSMREWSKLDWSLSSVNNNEKYEKVFSHQENNIIIWIRSRVRMLEYAVGTSILSFNLSTSEFRDLRSTKSCKGNEENFFLR